MVGYQVCSNAIPQLQLRGQRFGQGAIVVRSGPIQAVVLLAHDLGVIRADKNPSLRLDGTQPELKVGRSPAIRAIERSIESLWGLRFRHSEEASARELM